MRNENSNIRFTLYTNDCREKQDVKELISLICVHTIFTQIEEKAGKWKSPKCRKTLILRGLYGFIENEPTVRFLADFGMGVRLKSREW